MKKLKGFTLIEVLVIMFIITTLSIVLVVNWRKNEKRYQLQRSAQEVVQNLRKAQNMALAGKDTCNQEPSCTIPPNYGVYFGKTTLTSYVIFADKNNNGKYGGGESAEAVELINLGAGTEFMLSADLDIVFSVPDGFVLINSSLRQGEASLIIKKSGLIRDIKIIKIKKSGQITIQ
jgi:type II secretory pathway pseudopilin PulG